MKSSISRNELKMQTGKNETSNKRKIVCPNGTVPILRNTKEYVTNSQVFAEKHFHPLSADSPGTHVSTHLNFLNTIDLILLCIYNISSIKSLMFVLQKKKIINVLPKKSH